MPSINPLSVETVALEADTTGVNTGDARFTTRWHEDHPDWKGRLEKTDSYLDQRNLISNSIATAVQGDHTTVDWPVTWPASQVGSNDKEIYAVIRAEYRFIKDNAWKKVASKKGAQGIDSLFKKGSGNHKKFAICESKCTGSVSSYRAWLAGDRSPLSKLKKAHPQASSGALVSANGVRQNSRPWINHAFMQENRGSPDPQVRLNLKELRAWMNEKRRLPLLWLNVYGTDPFYLLPGVYMVRVQIAEFTETEAVSGRIIANWSDEKYRPLEFFSLDKRTTKSPGIKGNFQDYSTEYDQLCKRDQIDTEGDETLNRDVNVSFS